MEKGRKKLCICLTGVVLAAVLIGVFYYMYPGNWQQEETGDVLVKQEQQKEYGC